MLSDQRPQRRFNSKPKSRQQQRPPQRNQSFDSNGPNFKIRGSASQIFERYVALAREAATGGDRVAAENFYQHAEHYFRAAKESRAANQQGTPPRPTTPADVEMSPSRTAVSTELRDGDGDRSQAQWDSDSDDRSSVDSSTH